MAIKEVSKEQQVIEHAQVLVDNCTSCIELCKNGTFITHRRICQKPLEIFEQRESLVQSLSVMIQQLGGIAIKFAPEVQAENITVRRPLKESPEVTNSSKNMDSKSYTFLRSFLRRKRTKSESRKKSEKSGLIQKKKSFRPRARSERSDVFENVESRNENLQLWKMCNLVQNLCTNIGHLVERSFSSNAFIDENIISVFENTWAGVFNFEAKYEAFQNKQNISPTIPKGLSFPTESDVLCLIRRLTGIFEKVLSLKKLDQNQNDQTNQSLISNLTECHRYLRELHPILLQTFLENNEQL